VFFLGVRRTDEKRNRSSHELARKVQWNCLMSFVHVSLLMPFALLLLLGWKERQERERERESLMKYPTTVILSMYIPK
jgi:hypothetical protein